MKRKIKFCGEMFEVDAEGGEFICNGITYLAEPHHSRGWIVSTLIDNELEFSGIGQGPQRAANNVQKLMLGDLKRIASALGYDVEG